VNAKILALALAAALVPAPAYADDAAADVKTYAQMREHMKRMQQTMARMQETTHPAERQKLMTEHMQAMQEGMKTMRGMSGTMQGMTGYKEEAGSGMGGGGPMSPEMMELRVNMMQMMIEQMMQHQKASESPQK